MTEVMLFAVLLREDGSVEFNASTKNALADEIKKGIVSHAYIVEGLYGVGKKHFARRMAQLILCSGENKPCGSCPSCEKVLKDSHPDLHFYSCEGNSFKVAQVREIRKSVSMPPNDGEYGVFILDGAHNMTVAAQNALLKVFEEPPKGTVFFILTEKREALLPTVVSRGRIISLSPVSDDELREFLRQRFPKKSEEEREAALRLACGAAGKSEEFFEKQNKTALDSALKLAELIYSGAGRYRLYTSVLSYSKKREDFLRLLPFLEEIARDVAVYKRSGASGTVLSHDKLKSYGQSLGKRASAEVLEALLNTELALKTNANLNATLTALCGKLTEIFG